MKQVSMAVGRMLSRLLLMGTLTYRRKSVGSSMRSIDDVWLALM
jgi:hypothetical protein